MFPYRGRLFDRTEYALSPAGRGTRQRILRLDKKIARRLYNQGFVVRGDPPTFVPGERETMAGRVINPFTGRPINVGGRAYRNALRAGYVEYDDRLVQTTITVTIDPDWNDFEEANRQIAQEIARLEAEGRVVTRVSTVLDGDRAQIENFFTAANNRDRVYSILGAAIEGEEQYNEIRGPNGIEDPYSLLSNLDVSLEFEAVIANGDIVAGAGMAGECFIDALETAGVDRGLTAQALRKLRGDDDLSWVGPDDIGEVANACKVRIAINLYHTGGLMAEYGPPGARVINLYYSNNHLSISERVRGPRTVEWLDPEDDLWGTVADLKAQGVPHEFCAYKRDGEVVLSAVRTADNEYKRAFPNCKQYPTAFSAEGAAYLELKGKLGKISTPEPETANHFVHHGLTFNVANEEQGSEYYLYDQRRAYASHSLCPDYKGFPASYISVFEYDADALQNHEGFVYLTTEVTFPNSVFIKKRGYFAFPVVRAALEFGTPFEAVVMMVGERVEDPYAGKAREVPKHSYNKAIGKCWSTKAHDSVLTCDVAEGGRLRAEGYEACGAKEINDRVYTLYELKKTKRADLPHFAAYIHAYQQLSLYRDLVKPLVEEGRWDSVQRIWIDGVVLDEPLGFQLNTDRWKGVEVTKWKRQFEYPVNLDSDGPVIDITTTPGDWKYHEYLTSPRIAIVGEAGTGKSTLIRNLYQDDPRTLYCAPTHTAAEKLPHGDTIQAILHQVKAVPGYAAQLRGRRIVLDEYTMINTGDLDKLIELGVWLVLVGDEGQIGPFGAYKLTTISEQALRARGFLIKHLTKNYRAVAGDPLLELCRAIRCQDVTTQLTRLAAADFVRKIAPGEIEYPKAGERSHALASKRVVVAAYNKAYAQKIADEVGETILVTAKGNPICVGTIVMANNDSKAKGFCNQSIGIVTGSVARRGKTYLTVDKDGKSVDVLARYVDVGYALTYHRCQGQTYDFTTVIDANNTFDAGMIYTAVSRVRRASDLRIILPIS